MPQAVTRNADAKGRVTLGERFANRTVIIQELDETEVLVTLARVVPEREAWLYDNPTARTSVLRGLQQAKGGEFSQSPPDLDAAEALADTVEDA